MGNLEGVLPGLQLAGAKSQRAVRRCPAVSTYNIEEVLWP